MNELIVDVKLYDKNVGVLSWDKNRGLAEFQYYSDFFKNGLNVAPIVMPVEKKYMNHVFMFPSNRNDCFKGLPGMIADSLPDKYGNKIIDAWFAAQGLAETDVTPLDRLCYIGRRGMGALEFFPNRNIKGLDDSTILRIESLVDLADKVFQDRESFRESINQEDKAILDILKVGTSAGGAKPKALIALNERTGEIRSGQVKAPAGFTYWLLKFDGKTFIENGEKINHPKGISNIEYAYYKMAVDCQIKMTECRLLQERDSFHFMTKRFDRTDDGEKIHIQTLAAIAHYNRDVLHSYEEAFRVIRKLGLNYEDTEQMFRRMVFNVIARNHDDHTKNHGFLMDKKGRWSLAPAYDLCYSYSPKGEWTSVHQMSVNGKRDAFLWKDLTDVGRSMDIKDVDSIIEQIVDVVSRWNKYAASCGVYSNHSLLIGENHRLLRAPLRAAVKFKNDELKENNNRISDITLFELTDGIKKIRCKIDGVQQMGEILSHTDRQKYEELKQFGTENEINSFKEELAMKYFKEQLECKTSHSLKR